MIRRDISPRSRGGHAYCLVGYNEIGFLVQNSWGPTWGSRGFATLPYDDWLDSAYDAWVARPGVPQTPFYSGRTRTAAATGGELATAAGPDLRRLAYHVVNTGNDGRLSSTGKFVSNPAQVERVVGHMEAVARLLPAPGPGYPPPHRPVGPRRRRQRAERAGDRAAPIQLVAEHRRLPDQLRVGDGSPRDDGLGGRRPRS